MLETLPVGPVLQYVDRGSQVGSVLQPRLLRSVLGVSQQSRGVIA